MTNMTKKKRGFTLIELIVVIAIIGILLTIAIPRLNKYIVEAKTISALASARSIYTAVTQYELNHTREENLYARAAHYTTGPSFDWTINENGDVIAPSLLDDYLDSNYKLVPNPSQLFFSKDYTAFSVATYPFGDTSGEIAVYYKDPRMPDIMDFWQVENGKFMTMGGTAIIAGVPMVIGASGLEEEVGFTYGEGTGTNYLVPADIYFAMYEEAVKKQ